MDDIEHKRDRQAIYDVLEALRKDIELAGGSGKVSLALHLSQDTISRWPNPYHSAKPTLPHLIRVIEITGGEHLLPALQKVALQSLKRQAIDQDAAQKEIEYLRKLVAEK